MSYFQGGKCLGTLPIKKLNPFMDLCHKPILCNLDLLKDGYYVFPVVYECILTGSL